MVLPMNEDPKCEICNGPMWLSQGYIVEWKCRKNDHSENEWRAYCLGLKKAIAILKKEEVVEI